MNHHSIIRACDKEVRPLLRQITEMGGLLKITGKNHVMIRLGGRTQMIALTPTDPRNDLHNLRKIIREHTDGAVEPVSSRHRKPTKKGKRQILAQPSPTEGV